MKVIVKSAVAALGLLTLAACSRLDKGGQDEMGWARAALDRNDRLQVVASDPQAHTFTVRLKDSGEVRVVSVDQLMAGPAGTPDATAENNSGSNSPPVSPGEAASSAPRTGSDASAAQASDNSAAAPAMRTAGNVPPDGTADSDHAQSPNGSQAETLHAQSAADAKAGSVLASGPGYSIKASGSSGAATRQAGGATAARNVPVERLHEPIICQGARLLHIDNRNLEFDGDAVTAESGCEIHITNSHIRAKGVGVLARAANVHIENSEIDGDGGAIDASEGAQVYAEASRFKGVTRHMEASAWHDLGGNVWN